MSGGWEWVRRLQGNIQELPSGGGEIASGPPPNGTWYVYEGHYYAYSNGKWFDESGNNAWIPVWFVTTPFQNFSEGVFAAPAAGMPWPAWGTGNQVSDDPIALATHIEQMRGVLVMCYMDANSSVRIPIRDHDLGPDGQVIYGDSLLDPSIPPMPCFRFNTNATSDIVNTPSSTTATWSSYSVGARGITASDNAQWSVTLTLEKDPQPHWVLNVGYTDNAGVGGSSRTFACWLVGVGAPIDYSGDDWEVGSAGVGGHYHIYLPFDLVVAGRQNFLEDGGSIARTKFMQRTAFWNEEYIAPNSNAVVYLTDTGATGGGDVYATQVPPCVWVFGDDVLDQDRGTTVANLRMSSWGIGFVVDGYLTEEDAAASPATSGRSIQTPSADEYCSVDYVGTYGASNEWGVNIYNLCNTLNINTNPRAPASGTGNRHYVAFAFGVDADTSSAAAGNRLWSKQVAATTMDTAVLRERALWVARVNLTGGYGVVWWTDDGSSSGDNLFDTGLPVCAVAIASDPRKAQTWTIDGHYGPMIRSDVTGADGQFMYLTFQSGGKWVTEIVMGGLAASGLLSQGDNADRQVVLYAMGASA